jgi:spermidine/putrescine transport system substrate-binding protein
MGDVRSSKGVLNRRELFGYSAALGMGAVLLAGSQSQAGAASAAPVKAKKDGSTLALFGWEGYWAPSVMKAFEKEYGIIITQTYETGETDGLTKVASGQPFDCCITNSAYLHQLIKGGVLRKIDHSELTNYSQVIPAFRNPFYDPGAKYSVGYAMAPIGLAWLADRTGDMTGSWADLWTHARKLKPHAYCTSNSEAIAIGLMYSGFPENSVNPTELDAAVKALQKLKPYIGGFESINTIQILTNGQAWMIPTYTGNAYTAILTMKDPGNLRFQLCKEGGFFNADNMSISASAQHPGNGMLFIDWMLQPENMAANVDYIGYPTPTTQGIASYTKLVSTHPFLDIPLSQMTDWTSWEAPQTAAQAGLWNQMWLDVEA